MGDSGIGEVDGLPPQTALGSFSRGPKDLLLWCCGKHPNRGHYQPAQQLHCSGPQSPTECGQFGRAFLRISTPHSARLAIVSPQKDNSNSPTQRLRKIFFPQAESGSWTPSSDLCVSLASSSSKSSESFAYLHICTPMCTECFCSVCIKTGMHCQILESTQTFWVIIHSCHKTHFKPMSASVLQLDHCGMGTNLNLKKFKCPQRLMPGHKNN